MRALSVLSLFLLLLVSPPGGATDMGRVSKDNGSQTTEDMGRVSVKSEQLKRNA